MQDGTTPQQIHEAALAVVRTGTDSTTRAAASHFLEQWTCTDGAWVTNCQWLESWNTAASPYYQNDGAESISVQLLCLQLLQSKILREIKYYTSSTTTTSTTIPINMLQTTLSSYLQHAPSAAAGVQPACICVTALAIRSGHMEPLLASICTHGATVSVQQFLILSNIPLEMEEISDLSSSQVTAVLAPYCATVLECLRVSIQQSISSQNRATLLAAVCALKNWIQLGHITISQLHAGADQSDSLLVSMVHLLSTAGVSVVTEEAVLVQTADALRKAVLVPADSLTDTRHAACAVMLKAVSQSGFLSAILQNNNDCNWEDAAIAVASLMGAIITEEIDDFIRQPAADLLHLLIELQMHPIRAVRMAVLECWLTLSAIPVMERHEHCRAPLFKQLTAALLHSIEHGEGVNEDDLEDYRRMVVDVLVASYFLLRSDYVQHMVSIILDAGQTQLVKVEAALFALTATAREVNARVHSKATGICDGNSRIGQDRQRTKELLLQALQHICGTRTQVDSRDFNVGVAKFIGSYALTWDSQCSVDNILRLLTFAQNMLIAGSISPVIFDDPFGGSLAEESAKTIKALLVGCTSTLLTSDTTTLRDCLCGLMEASLSSHDVECMAAVTEGCTRLILQVNDVVAIRQLLSYLIRPVLHSVEAALNLLPLDGSVSLSDDAAPEMES